MIPSKNPISIPILIFFINIPNTSPSMMAKIKAISLLRTFGFCCCVIKIISTYQNFAIPFLLRDLPAGRQV